MDITYQETIRRFEPDISSMVNRDAALASIAISLKRIADYMDREYQDGYSHNHKRIIADALDQISLNTRPR